VSCFRYETKLGWITIAGNGEALTGLFFENDLNSKRLDALSIGASFVEDDLLLEAHRQLDAYLEKKLKCFDLPLLPAGTPFMRSVWDALIAIPWGEVSSYGDIARAVGKPGASRAVGLANGRNPLPIFIPCHRVLRANGDLGGYSGGLAIKVRLLAIEDRPFVVLPELF
jgi:methylated-DNA-[protein]-cysteine S-methyltransferase